MRWRPEWRVVVIVAAAWAVLAAGHGSRWERSNADIAAHHGHQPQHQSDIKGASGGFVAALPAWALMSLAMMTPATLPAVRHVGLNSVRRRRQWAMGLYFSVYVAVWVVFGLLALASVHFAGAWLGLDDGALIAPALAAAAAWQLTRWKRRAIYACRRTVPLPPSGLRADVGCVRFALHQGARGVQSCWALMAVMAVVGHSSLVWMAALTIFVVIEEQTMIGRKLLAPSAAAFAAGAGAVMLAA